MVERNLAKVKVASSRLVSRSKSVKGRLRHLPFFCPHVRRDSKAVMQRIANPCRPVRLRLAPPKRIGMLLASPSTGGGRCGYALWANAPGVTVADRRALQASEARTLPVTPASASGPDCVRVAPAGCEFAARVAKLVDAADLKSAGLDRPCRFDSGPGHKNGTALAGFLARWAKELGVSYEELLSTLNYAGPTFKDLTFSSEALRAGSTSMPS